MLAPNAATLPEKGRKEAGCCQGEHLQGWWVVGPGVSFCWLIRRIECWPRDDVIFKIASFSLTDAAITRRCSRFADTVRVSCDQRMPFRKWQAIRQPLVGAGRWKPVDGFQHGSRQGDAILHFAVTSRVVDAAACVGVEQAAGDVCIVETAVILIAQLVQTATPAAVAKGFPLLGGHLVEGFGFPEGDVDGHDERYPQHVVGGRHTEFTGGSAGPRL